MKNEKVAKGRIIGLAGPCCFSFSRSFALLYFALITVVLFDVFWNGLFIPPRRRVCTAAASLERSYENFVVKRVFAAPVF